MRRTGMRRLLLLMIVLLLPGRSYCAEGVKLKYAYTIYADEKGISLNQPEGVACSGDRLVVADSGNGRIIIYPLQNGEPVGGKEIKLPQVLYPIRVKMSTKGEVFVLDERQRKIVRLTAEGSFNTYVDLGGLPTASTVVPAGIDLDSNDNLYVLDILGSRVLVFDVNGKFQRQIDFPKEYGFFTDLAVDGKGTVFLIDSVSAIVYSTAKDPAVFSPFTGRLKDDVKFAGNATTDAAGMLYISDQNSGGVIVVGKDGSVRTRQLSLGWKEGAVRYPSQLCIDKDGNNLFIADRANSRVQEFTLLK